MELQTAQVISIVFVISILMIFIIGFFVFLIIKSRARHNSYISEKRIMETTFEQALLQTQVEIQEQTLRNVSQEIHDNIGQVLSLVSLNINTLSATDPEKLEHTGALITKAIDDLRGLSKSLNPERVQQVGIKEALEQALKQIERTGKYKISVYFDDDITYPSSEQTVIIYRMVQEVLNNIIKHARATEIMLVVSGNALETMITLTDNGQGFHYPVAGGNGMGLQNIYRRATMIGAEVNITSKLNQGTTVSFMLKTTSSCTI